MDGGSLASSMAMASSGPAASQSSSCSGWIHTGMRSWMSAVPPSAAADLEVGATYRFEATKVEAEEPLKEEAPGEE